MAQSWSENKSMAHLLGRQLEAFASADLAWRESWGLNNTDQDSALMAWDEAFTTFRATLDNCPDSVAVTNGILLGLIQLVPRERISEVGDVISGAIMSSLSEE